MVVVVPALLISISLFWLTHQPSNLHNRGDTSTIPTIRPRYHANREKLGNRAAGRGRAAALAGVSADAGSAPGPDGPPAATGHRPLRPRLRGAGRAVRIAGRSTAGLAAGCRCSMGKEPALAPLVPDDR